ncbi:hypothetical protein K0M31_018665 [Melipona bicolor]|uniref:Uncharacterized protein n=1 Tax=Melipona bicolor TaxID=60889 RepID=A0AA40KRV8_9HYME|nr:hypothetical protein K0M31_018665 [Melipona bicolor]
MENSVALARTRQRKSHNSVTCVNNGRICATSYFLGKEQTNKRKRGIIAFLDKQGRRDSNPRQQFTTGRKEIPSELEAAKQQRGLRAIDALSFGEESRQRVEENEASLDRLSPVSSEERY